MKSVVDMCRADDLKLGLVQVGRANMSRGSKTKLCEPRLIAIIEIVSLDP